MKVFPSSLTTRGRLSKNSRGEALESLLIKIKSVDLNRIL